MLDCLDRLNGYDVMINIIFNWENPADVGDFFILVEGLSMYLIT